MATLSEPLQRLIASEPDSARAVHLHLLVRRGLDREQLPTLLARLADETPGVEIGEVLGGAGIVLVQAPLRSVHALAAAPELEWIDIDSEAPLESLLDSPR